MTKNQISSFKDYQEKPKTDEQIDEIFDKIKELLPDIEKHCDFDAARTELMRRRELSDKAELNIELFRIVSGFQMLLKNAGVPSTNDLLDIFMITIVRLEALGLIRIK